MTISLSGEIGDVSQPVSGIQFSIMSSQDIERLSVKAFSAVTDNLNDPKLGPASARSDTLCATCSSTYAACPGHFGHINLTSPVYSPNFIDATRKVLNCVCHVCHTIRLSPANDAAELAAIRLTDPQNRLARVADYVDSHKGHSCPCEKDGNACGAAYRKYTAKVADRPTIQLYFFDENQRAQAVTARAAREILTHISDEDARLLGFNPGFSHPRDLIIEKLLVPPPCMRPDVETAGEGTSRDDLTRLLQDILTCNSDLSTEKKNHSGIDDGENQTYFTLAMKVWTYFKNGSTGTMESDKGRVLKGIKERLESKSGHVRSNIMGKRSNFTARTVITGDAILAMDELGIPKTVAMTLTQPEVVTASNIELMKKLVSNGPTSYPGAVQVSLLHANDFYLNASNLVERAANLQIGDTVHRHLHNGDWVMFNRQPSLHKMSLMGHKVRVLPYSTFRLNLSCTTPYNADFDGDEMNLHAPQSLTSRAEIQEIMAVARQVVSPQKNAPVMGIVQDSLLGTYLITHPDRFFTRGQIMQMGLWTGSCGDLGVDASQPVPDLPTPAILWPTPMWTGKQIFSMLVPPNMNLEKANNTHNSKTAGHKYCSDTDTYVVIRNSELLTGRVDKSVVGSSAGGLIHSVWIQHGPKACTRFMTSIMRVIRLFMQWRGYSIGYQDTIPGAELSSEVDRLVKNAYTELQVEFEKACNGTIHRTPGETVMAAFETAVNSKLNGALKDSKNAAEQHIRDNNIRLMADSGSKGNATNISQIMIFVGQQNLEGKRIPCLFQGSRTLPHFTHFAFEKPTSRGFCRRSYNHGLEPEELWMHAMGGREGLSDTAIKTADTGYIQRRLGRFIGNCSARYDQSIRDDNDGTIFQFLYGEDGFDATCMERANYTPFTMSDDKLRKTYSYDDEKKAVDTGARFGESWLTDEGRSRMHELVENDTHLFRFLNDELEQIVRDRNTLRECYPDSTDGRVCFALNISRILLTQSRIATAAKAASTTGLHTAKTSLDPVTAITMVRKLCEDIYAFSASHATPDLANAQSLLVLAGIRDQLSSRNVCVRLALDEQSLATVCDEIKNKYRTHMVQGGEAVGIIAAQSISEPATQMTLNTFHFAGVSAKNATLGVPRLEELLSNSKNMKTPNMTIYPSPEACLPFVQESLVKLYEKGPTIFTSGQRRRDIRRILEKVVAAVNGCAPAAGDANGVIDSVTSVEFDFNANRDPATFAPRARNYNDFGIRLANMFTELMDGLFVRNELDLSKFSSATKQVYTADEEKEPRTISHNKISHNMALGYIQGNHELVNASFRQLARVFQDQDAQICKAFAKRIAAEIEFSRLSSVTLNAQVVFDPPYSGNVHDPTTRVKSDLAFVTAVYHIREVVPRAATSVEWSPWIVRIVLDRAQMLRQNLSTLKVVAAIRKKYSTANLDIIASSDNDPELVIRARFAQEAGLGVNQMRTRMGQLLEVPIKGIQSISDAQVSDEEKRAIIMEDGSVQEVGEAAVFTSGIDLARVLALPDVDATRTMCNSTIETAEYLGIEAARACLLIEINRILTFDGNYINFRHINLLADCMTHFGKLLSVDRNGISHLPGRWLLKATFETIVLTFAEASMHGARDPATDTYSSVMMGEAVPVGTGAFDVISDMSVLWPTATAGADGSSDVSSLDMSALPSAYRTDGTSDFSAVPMSTGFMGDDGSDVVGNWDGEDENIRSTGSLMLSKNSMMGSFGGSMYSNIVSRNRSFVSTRQSQVSMNRWTLSGDAGAHDQDANDNDDDDDGWA